MCLKEVKGYYHSPHLGSQGREDTERKKCECWEGDRRVNGVVLTLRVDGQEKVTNRVSVPQSSECSRWFPWALGINLSWILKPLENGH